MDRLRCKQCVSWLLLLMHWCQRTICGRAHLLDCVRFTRHLHIHISPHLAANPITHFHEHCTSTFIFIYCIHSRTKLFKSTSAQVRDFFCDSCSHEYFHMSRQLKIQIQVAIYNKCNGYMYRLNGCINRFVYCIYEYTQSNPHNLSICDRGWFSLKFFLTAIMSV